MSSAAATSLSRSRAVYSARISGVNRRRIVPPTMCQFPSQTSREKSTSPPVKATAAPVSFVDKVAGFKQKESTRPHFNPSLYPASVTKTPNPEWVWGTGVKDAPEMLGDGSHVSHVEIDPFADGRPMMSNYRLLVSGIVPRPIGFLSTVSGDGKSENLSPFSYFQVIDHDPPTFVVGFSARPSRAKDTSRNLLESGECTINIVSEDMIEAVSATSVDAPYGVSEWEVSGLHRGQTTTVKPARVLESVFSIEGKLVDKKEFTGHAKPGYSAAAVVFIEATRFWVRGDALDESQSNIDINVLKPVAQLGGISYGRVSEIFELPRSTWKDAVQQAPWLEGLRNAKKE